ncbi:Cys-tRNA(Pro) deacylase [Adlercreutzia sp. ZJ473]|uniref:Cys-tRNA(Pro) deacylase n=1 Tax=Adlercreutzia sp. ZJ473 TaxID=2722822 RepID=UPI001555C033|nr:Cys-tRNA(Pro) deacylase [Adlercreutzia sp. ZJ473]
MAKQAHDHKTNAMRVLDAANVAYDFRMFDCEGAPSGVEVAAMLGLDPDRVFKTLVTQGKSGGFYVFMIPVAAELDLKKAASAAGEKAVHMIKSRELLPLTGYVHGGCSPIGMKKLFPTFVDETAQLFERIMFSGGRIGCQVELAPDDLGSVVPYEYADLTSEPLPRRPSR